MTVALLGAGRGAGPIGMLPLALSALGLRQWAEKGGTPMTEQEWLECDDPVAMLSTLPPQRSRRKATLYLCAGLRVLWPLLYDERSRQAVEVLERLADGKTTPSEVKAACYFAESPTFGYHFEPTFVRAFRNAESERGSIERLLDMKVYAESDLAGEERLGDEQTRTRLGNLAAIVEQGFGALRDGRVDEYLLRLIARQDCWPRGDLIREVFGNPCRSVKVNSAWLTSTVLSLASASYDERAFDRLPILADALEDAGCDNADILNHCRRQGEHVRGCWAVDIVLGKS
jgi:hypothetical protein